MENVIPVDVLGVELLKEKFVEDFEVVEITDTYMAVVVKVTFLAKIFYDVKKKLRKRIAEASEKMNRFVIFKVV